MHRRLGVAPVALGRSRDVDCDYDQPVRVSVLLAIPYDSIRMRR